MSSKIVKPVAIRERLLIRPGELAGLMTLNRARFAKVKKFLPRPVKFPDSRTQYYRLPEVVDWIAAGMPPVASWVWTPRISIDADAYFLALRRVEQKLEALTEELRERRR